VRAQILEVDTERRRIRLGMKQLQPTSIDEYIAEHKEGDVVTGRIAGIAGDRAKVELGEGITVSCKVAGAEAGPAESQAAQSGADLGSLSSMLAAKWKGGGAGSGAKAGKREPAKAGQIRSFKIVKLDAGGKKIEIELVG
jgi:small subunit ribosomal protein S1